MANPEKYVPRIVIQGHTHEVTPLEAHLRAVRTVLQEDTTTFALNCGIEPQTYSVLENRGIGKNIKPKTLKIIERLGNVPSLEGNPHAEAIVIILTLEGLKRSWRKFEANRTKDKKREIEKIRFERSFVDKIS